MTVDFFTYCCEKDRDKLYANFWDHLNSHRFSFDQVNLIHQRCEVGLIDGVQSHYIGKEDYPEILESMGVTPDNFEADKYTHGWDGPHFWKHHCVNHLFALRASNADYIVFSDADCHMKNPINWITQGIEMLHKYPEILVVSPSDGSAKGRTQNMSQQLFLCERERLFKIDFDLPFEGFKDGGPMAEYYFMLEGRISRYMEKHNLYRYIMEERFRYWHEQWH